MSNNNRQNSFLSKIPRAYYFFGIFCVLFVGLMVSIEIINGRFWTSDLVVYFGASKDYFNGADPYVHNYGLDTGYFKYAPTTLYFFLPSIWLSLFLVQILHIVLLTISLVFSILILYRLNFNNLNSKKYAFLMYAGFIVIAKHVVREFHMGNVNLLLLFLFCAGLLYLKRGKENTSAILWSIMIILKPIVILTFIPLAFYKKWKIVFLMAGLGAFYFILPILNSGTDGLIPIWSKWLDSISAHGGYIISENSLTYILEYYSGIKSNWGASIFFLMALLGFMFITVRRKIKIELFEWLAVFLAFCPNFFVTDTEHFLLSLPLIMLLVRYLLEKNIWYYWLMFAVSIFFFSFNINDLLGRPLSDTLDAMGMLGIANLTFIVLFLLVRTKSSRNKLSNQLN